MEELHGPRRTDRRSSQNLAQYAECDVKGTLAKFDTNDNNLIEYSSGTLPGNDADSVAFKYYGTARRRTAPRASFWYSGAQGRGRGVRAARQHGQGDRDERHRRQHQATRSSRNLWADGAGDERPRAPAGSATGDRVRRASSATRVQPERQRPSTSNLPAGIVSGLNDFTISAWVNPAATTTWSRVFDFGTGTDANMFLTVTAPATGPRFAITTGGGGGEQQLDPAPASCR